jgi:hypothetical protein
MTGQSDSGHQPAAGERPAAPARGWRTLRHLTLTPPPSDASTWYTSAAWWASLLFLTLAGLVLIWSLGSAFLYTMTHTGPPCSNPPARQAFPPQWVVVLLCLMAFVLGHFTSRWQFFDPRHTERHRTPSKRPYEEPRRREMLIVQSLLLVFLIEVAGLLIVEMVTLSRGVWPITYYIRCAYNASGPQTTLGAMAIAFLVGRWFWLPERRQRRARPSA